MCLFLFFSFILCFGGGVLELFWEFDSVFCKSKDFKAFLRCSCVHFFQFVFAIITIIICIFQIFFFICKEKKKSVFQKEACHSELRRMRKAFVCKQIRTKPDYAEPLRWSCQLLKKPPKNLREWKRRHSGPNHY